MHIILSLFMSRKVKAAKGPAHHLKAAMLETITIRAPLTAKWLIRNMPVPGRLTPPEHLETFPCGH
jgi:hypothetical protein